jgi:hypothetical protein
MRTKRVSNSLFLCIIITLAFAVFLPIVKADNFCYTWDSATHGTNIFAPLGQIGSEVDAYADAIGLIKVFAYGGIGAWGYAEAWAELYITLDGQGMYVRPIISYNAVGGRFNGGVATIKLTCIDRTTGEIIGEWSQTLPSFDPTTKTLCGDFFEARSGRQYLYWVKVYGKASINLNGDIKVDYRGTEAIPYYVKVNYLCIRDTCTLNIQTTTGGTTNLAPGTHIYSYGSSVTVKAIPSYGYVFRYWLLDGSTFCQNPVTIAMNADHMLKAYFKASSGGGGGGYFRCRPMWI